MALISLEMLQNRLENYLESLKVKEKQSQQEESSHFRELLLSKLKLILLKEINLAETTRENMENYKFETTLNQLLINLTLLEEENFKLIDFQKKYVKLL